MDSSSKNKALYFCMVFDVLTRSYLTTYYNFCVLSLQLCLSICYHKIVVTRMLRLAAFWVFIVQYMLLWKHYMYYIILCSQVLYRMWFVPISPPSPSSPIYFSIRCVCELIYHNNYRTAIPWKDLNIFHLKTLPLFLLFPILFKDLFLKWTDSYACLSLKLSIQQNPSLNPIPRLVFLPLRSLMYSFSY